jgi:hypothetical protein
MSASPIYIDVEGAPFRIGERVRVGGSNDETFDRCFKGRLGLVEYFEYECGCGQSFPLDPMIGVRFCNGDIEEFWAEELRRQRRRKSDGSLRARTIHGVANIVAD